MADYSRETKQKLGTLLLRLKRKEHGLTEEEWTLAKVLDGKGLARYNGPDMSPSYSTIGEAHARMTLAALSGYELTGQGQAFVLQYTDDQLANGLFRFPGELPWFESWPWKLLLPAIISAVFGTGSALVIWAIKG